MQDRLSIRACQDMILRFVCMAMDQQRTVVILQPLCGRRLVHVGVALNPQGILAQAALLALALVLTSFYSLKRMILRPLIELKEPYGNDSFYSTSVFAAPTAVPEPSTYGLLGTAMLLALALVRRFRLNRG